jgi:hypothetical protein
VLNDGGQFSVLGLNAQLLSDQCSENYFDCGGFIHKKSMKTVLFHDFGG